jgi:hypothetical protein
MISFMDDRLVFKDCEKNHFYLPLFTGPNQGIVPFFFVTNI